MAGCPYCGSKDVRKDGMYRYKARALQSWECRGCWRKFNDRTQGPFRGLWYPAHVVILAVMAQSQLGLSAAETQLILLHTYNLRPGKRTLTRWVNRFSPHLVNLENNLRPQFTDVWMIDEVFLNRHAHTSKRKPSPRYLYNVLDSKRQLVACLVTEKRDTESVLKVLDLAVKRAGKTPKIISRDGCGIYNRARNILRLKLPGCRWVESHFKAVPIPVETVETRFTPRSGFFKRTRRGVIKISQNYVERYNVTPRGRENSMRGVKTNASGNAYFQALGVSHNLFKPHEAHGGKPPAEAMGWSPGLRWRDLSRLLHA